MEILIDLNVLLDVSLNRKDFVSDATLLLTKSIDTC